jgi:UDP-N-acetylmuramoylalanine--D-glutamate ligase
LAAHARAIVCFGRAGPDIAEALDGLPVTCVRNLEEAVLHAGHLARTGDAILLSPACASFDEFRDFEHRGEVFAELARTSPAPDMKDPA